MLRQRRRNCVAFRRVRPRLLLASNSPRRRELLLEAGFEFEIFATRVDERFHVDLTLRELTALNAIRKAMATARLRPKNIVLAADTLVADRVLGKPKDKDHAVAMLRRLSGRAHEVCTSVFICDLASAKSASFHEISRVHFHRLSRDKIGNYLARVDPLDKAGAYAAQGLGSEIIEKIDGSYTNVVGLPMEKTITALAEFGVTPKTGPVRPGP
ncbi:septum formation protein Maf [Candidatus Bathyarchaeota archaeon]|nr:MAG: septum formation protein Maf [Candidatus Bathyarchaeota archaeon]